MPRLPAVSRLEAGLFDPASHCVGGHRSLCEARQDGTLGAIRRRNARDGSVLFRRKGVVTQESANNERLRYSCASAGALAQIMEPLA